MSRSDSSRQVVFCIGDSRGCMQLLLTNCPRIASTDLEVKDSLYNMMDYERECFDRHVMAGLARYPWLEIKMAGRSLFS